MVVQATALAVTRSASIGLKSPSSDLHSPAPTRPPPAEAPPVQFHPPRRMEGSHLPLRGPPPARPPPAEAPPVQFPPPRRMESSHLPLRRSSAPRSIPDSWQQAEASAAFLR